MCSFGAVVLVALCALQAHAYDYNNYYDNNYNNYGYHKQKGLDEILQRAADRTRYETELRVSCDTGDDRACFELFLSVNRMALYFTVAILLAIILLAICIGVCCYCKRKRQRRRERQTRFTAPSTQFTTEKVQTYPVQHVPQNNGVEERREMTIALEAQQKYSNRLNQRNGVNGSQDLALSEDTTLPLRSERPPRPKKIEPISIKKSSLV